MLLYRLRQSWKQGNVDKLAYQAGTRTPKNMLPLGNLPSESVSNKQFLYILEIQQQKYIQL